MSPFDIWLSFVFWSLMILHALNSETLFCTNNFLSVCCGWLAGFTDNWFGCTLTTAKVTRLRKIQGYTGLCQKNLKSKVTRFQKLRGYTAGFASRFSKVTGLQRLRRLRRAMLEDFQRLQGFRSCEVAQSYDWSFSKVAGLRRLRGALGYIIHTSKVTRLQGLQGLRGSLSDKFQRYSPSFDIIIIIIILKVDIRGCEVARVSWFRRAISTHITCHI